MEEPSLKVALATQLRRREVRGEWNTVQGWLGQTKGLKQTLWERGLIDATKLSSYSKDGPNDEEGHRDTTFSLEVIMESCLDFLQEKASLQKLGEVLVGVMIEHTRNSTLHQPEKVWSTTGVAANRDIDGSR
jgi:hypothetical protein